MAFRSLLITLIISAIFSLYVGRASSNSFVFSIGPADSLFAKGALDKTVDKFLGFDQDSKSKNQEQSNLLSISNLSSGLLVSNNKKPNFINDVTLEFGVSKSFKETQLSLEISDLDFDFNFRVLAGHRRASYLLPNGAGILTDPIILNFKNVYIEPALLVSKPSVFFNKVSGTFYTVGGTRFNQTKTRIVSELLAIHNKSPLRQNFLGFGMSINTSFCDKYRKNQFPQPSIKFELRSNEAEDRTWSPQIRASLNFLFKKKK